MADKRERQEKDHDKQEKGKGWREDPLVPKMGRKEREKNIQERERR